MDSKEELLSWLYGLSMHGIKLGLRNIRELLRRIGNPEHSFRTVHVAGTDGKGSTCAMLASVLRESGIRTGLYTSPHILEFNERISVDGGCITDARLIDLVKRIRPIVEDMRTEGVQCTFFEVTTAIAFEYFKEERVEYAVIEVGMGGRFDATNVIMPDVTIITNISMEHTEYLGDTIEKIAYEKAGIIKKGIPVITNNTGAALDIIDEVASDVGSDVFVADEAEAVSMHERYTVMTYAGREYTVGIPGGYQAMNAEMVIEAVEHLPCRKRLIDHVSDGLEKVRWPCRMQRIDGMPIIVDSSHTGAGSRAMAESVFEIYGKVAAVFGVLGDKDIDSIAENLSMITDHIILTTPNSERAAPMDRVEAAVRRYIRDVTVCPDVNDAFERGLAERNGMYLLITGSFFMSEAALRWLGRTSV